jgi:excisionase family DNA binding protein
MVVAEAPGTDTPILTKSFYSPTEVARLASVSNSTILNYIRSEKLAAVRLSARVYRIPRKSVMLLLGLPTKPIQFTSDPYADVSLE